MEMNPNAVALGSMIRQKREAKGLTLLTLARQLSDRLGQDVEVGPGYMSDLERGRIQRPDKERLRILAEILDLPVDELYRLADYHLEPAEEMIEIPIGDMSAGPGIFTDEVFYLPKNQVASERIVGYRVQGNSMEPDIPEGSIVAVDLDASPKAGDIVAAWTPDGGVVKRLIERDRQMMLLGRSGAAIPVTEDVRIEGVVIFSGRFL